MIRKNAVVALGLTLVLHAGVTIWALSRNPFARPIVARSAAEVKLALERAMAQQVTPEWLTARLSMAVAAGDVDRIALYQDLATEHGIALPPALQADAQLVMASHEGMLATVRDCMSCAYDIRNCPSLAMIGVCSLPVEISPLGDLNVLRRAAVAAATGNEVDGIEAGLAVIGLAATGAIVVTGSTSATAKLGATAIRVGRRLGTVSVQLTKHLGEAVEGLIRWDRVPAAIRTREFDAVVDVAKFARLSEMSADLGQVYERTSAVESIGLLRYADDADDLRRLSRVAEAAGKDTRKAFEVLGKARAFRLLDRVANIVLLAMGMVALLLSQLASLLLWLVLRGLRRALRRPSNRRVRTGTTV